MPESFERQEFARTRININDKYEIAHWTARLNVSEQQLRDAVSRVGVLASDVERETRSWPSNSKKAK
jgi:hypothetical protein